MNNTLVPSQLEIVSTVDKPVQTYTSIPQPYRVQSLMRDTIAYPRLTPAAQTSSTDLATDRRDPCLPGLCLPCGCRSHQKATMATAQIINCKPSTAPLLSAHARPKYRTARRFGGAICSAHKRQQHDAGSSACLAVDGDDRAFPVTLLRSSCL